MDRSSAFIRNVYPITERLMRVHSVIFGFSPWFYRVCSGDIGQRKGSMSHDIRKGAWD